MWYNLIKEFFPIENSITEYRMIQNNRVGKHGEFGKYDLLRLLFVGLSKELVGQTDEHHLHRLLETLLLPGLILVLTRWLLVIDLTWSLYNIRPHLYSFSICRLIIFADFC